MSHRFSNSTAVRRQILQQAGRERILPGVLTFRIPPALRYRLAQDIKRVVREVLLQEAT